MHSKEYFECNQLLSGSCRIVFRIHKAHHVLPGEQGPPQVFQPCAFAHSSRKKAFETRCLLGDPRSGGCKEMTRKTSGKKDCLPKKMKHNRQRRRGKRNKETIGRNSRLQIPIRIRRRSFSPFREQEGKGSPGPCGSFRCNIARYSGWP